VRNCAKLCDVVLPSLSRDRNDATLVKAKMMNSKEVLRSIIMLSMDEKNLIVHDYYSLVNTTDENVVIIPSSLST